MQFALKITANIREANVAKFNNPAIVIGMALGGLGVTRSLAKMGVKVYCVDTDLNKPEMQTNQGT